MFGRPRCREWTPLATQQLRLRSLIQIVGYNIRPPEQCMSACSFYLTLHHTTMSAPFYTSERISSPHPKWKEIDSEITQRMSSTNVVIRIWCHSINEDTNKHNDTVIQTWGVYFSGLRYIGANLALNFTSDCFKSNTLVFQMLGGYFCSYKSLKLDIIPPENETVPGSLSSDSSGRTNLSKITLESKFLQHQKVKESRSVSPNKFSKKFEREYSKSHSPVERGLKNYPAMKTSNSMNMNQTRRREESVERKQDPNYIYEHSPESMEVACDINCDIVKKASREELFDSKIDLSETAESYDLRNESDRVPKYRYLAINFLKSEIRPSYNASKLQKLHLLQYSIKKRQEAVQEIKERIYKKSAMSYDWSQSEECDDKLKFKSKSQRNLFSPEEESEKMSTSQSDLSKNGRVKEERPVSNGPRLTLKLNDLLSFKTKPSPFQRSEHIRLTKQLEILRFKRIILADERDSKLANIRRLKEIHAKLLEENQDVGLELLQDYHALSRRSEILKETRQSCGALRELAARSHAQLVTQRNLLLLQLHQIFYIHQKDETTWTICDVPLPICSDAAPPPGLAGAVAAGLAGQAASLAAAVTSQPLRYRITLLGSASKILDTRVNDLPEPNIPLYPRGGDASLFSYALFLLNKCIAQLMWGRGLPVHDIRPTLHNLQRLLTTSSSLTDSSKLFGAYRWFTDSQCPRTQSLRSLVASERGKHNRQFNRFKDAVDGQSPAIAMNLRRHRHSRSVGSYQDDQDLPALDASTASIMGSEPNIYDTKLAQSNCEGHTLKTHNSDSEISRISLDHAMEETGTKVVFTLGDSDTLESEKLVRISSNNDDEIACSTCLNDNVSRICSEITDFCTKDQEAIDIAKHMEDLHLAGEMTGIDIAQHMARASEIENADLCINCESNKDGMCDLACANDVMDVIVIPSAEAILDTGQREMPIATDRECE